MTLLTATTLEAQAWEASYFNKEGEQSCTLAERNSDGTMLMFGVAEGSLQKTVVILQNPGWSYSENASYNDVALGTEQGRFGPSIAHGTGDGLVVILQRAAFDNFVRTDVADGDSFGVTKGDQVIASFPLRGLRAGYDELVACEALKLTPEKPLPKDPFAK